MSPRTLLPAVLLVLAPSITYGPFLPPSPSECLIAARKLAVYHGNAPWQTEGEGKGSTTVKVTKDGGYLITGKDRDYKTGEVIEFSTRYVPLGDNRFRVETTIEDDHGERVLPIREVVGPPRASGLIAGANRKKALEEKAAREQAEMIRQFEAGFRSTWGVSAEAFEEARAEMKRLHPDEDAGRLSAVTQGYAIVLAPRANAVAVLKGIRKHHPTMTVETIERHLRGDERYDATVFTPEQEHYLQLIGGVTILKQLGKHQEAERVITGALGGLGKP